MGKYRSLLETTENTRDLGGYRITVPAARSELSEAGIGRTNEISSQAGDQAFRYTKRGVILRSDVPTHPSERDIDFLLRHQITTIIDLRGEKEVAATPNPLSAMESFHYYNAPLEEGVVPDSPEAVPAVYMQFTEAENMRLVFAHIASAEDGVLFHCSSGKDRTGVVAAILLLLAGVSREEIVADHVLTREYVHERFVRFFAEHPEIDRTIVIPRESYMNGFLDRFLARYGNGGAAVETAGAANAAPARTPPANEDRFAMSRTAVEMAGAAVNNYLRQIGLSRDQIEHIRRKLAGACV